MPHPLLAYWRKTDAHIRAPSHATFSGVRNRPTLRYCFGTCNPRCSIKNGKHAFKSKRGGWSKCCSENTDSSSVAKTFYGATCDDAAKKAARFIASRSDQSGTAASTLLPQGSPASPPQILQVQKSD